MPIQIGQRPAHDFSSPLAMLSDCHRRIEHFLAVLSLLAKQSGDGRLPDAARADLQAALTYFAVAAPRHTADEEVSVFPRLRSSGNPAAQAAIDLLDALERDHQEADRRHHDVDTLGHRWLASGALSVDEMTTLRTHLERLEAIYARHIKTEDVELFPAAAAVLSRDQLRQVGQEMAARRGTRTADTPLVTSAP